MTDSDSADSDFEDAKEEVTVPSSSDLSDLVEDARIAVHHFFNNNFIEGRKILEPHAKTSMYHALGYSVFEFLEAILTFHPEQIHKASAALSQSLEVSNQFRHKQKGISETLGKMVGKTYYDSYSMAEVHAELCYAETLLLKSMLSFVEDETLVSFIKAGMKIRACYKLYTTCHSILRSRNWKDEKLKIHFESGVRMGVGVFNLMISQLPGRVIKLLEFIGFSGSKEVGLHELLLGSQLKNSIRQVLCVMTLLGYHLIATYYFSHVDGDLNLCDKIVKEQLALYPSGVWFLFFKARLEFMKGNISSAQVWYNRSWKSQDLWPQFHHICFWELMWTYTMSMNWLIASEFADYLLQESKWSRTIYSYQKASLLVMLGDKLTDDQKLVIEDLMSNAPRYKQRIAGKSLPMEKFVIKRANRYFAQKKWLCVPSLELMYLWNMFRPLSKNKSLMVDVLKRIDNEIDNLPTQGEFVQDNKSLLHLLKGCSLRYLCLFLQAEKCFQYILDNAQELKEDTFLVPYATYELAMVFIEQHNYTKASEYLEIAKKNYTGYSLESRLHFRIHSAGNFLHDVLTNSSNNSI